MTQKQTASFHKTLVQDKPRILIVDDDGSLCKCVEEALSGNGLSCTSVQDPIKALKTIHSNQHEIAILDINMPKMDGISLAKEIKKTHPHVGIIIITGYGSLHNAVEAIKAGVYDFIQKPFKIDELLLSVKRLGKLLELEREVASKTEDLKKSEKRYRTLIENTADGVALIQKDKIVFHNKALRKILGYDQRTLNKGRLQDLIYVDDRETAGRYMKDILGGSDHGPTQYRLKKKDGSVCWASVNTTIIEYQGQPTPLSSFRDITPSVEMDNMRKDMERMLRHDMRSQLIGILGFTNRLINHTPLTEPQLEYCRNIQRCGVQLENMIETYLDISRLEQGFFVLKKDHLNLLDVVKQSRDALRELADRKNINIAMIFNHKMYSIEDSLSFFGDRIYLQNAFNNLLKNAIEASPPDMGVKIKVQEKETHIKVSISNWGIVSEEIRARFFEKYASFGKKDGLGLGTYMARLVVQGHGGSITLQSSKEDGTTVIMELPQTNS